MPNHPKFISDTFTIEGNDKVYDFNKCLSFIEYHGKAQYGQSFKINEIDVEICCFVFVFDHVDNQFVNRWAINFVNFEGLAVLCFSMVLDK